MAWQKAHDDGWYSLDETATGPEASIIGDRLPAHREDEQSVALAIGTKAANRMAKLAEPVSMKVG